jgi:hypothetical protein
MHGKNGVDAISLIEPTMHPNKKEDARFQVTERPQAWQAVTAPSDVIAPHGKLVENGLQIHAILKSACHSITYECHSTACHRLALQGTYVQHKTGSTYARHKKKQTAKSHVSM